MTPATVACDAYSRARDRITCMHLLRTRLTTWGGASVHYLLIASPVAPLANLIHIGAEDALGALG